MSNAGCPAPLGFEALVEYWLGEIDAGKAAAVDEHLLGCGECSSRLHGLVDLAEGIRALVRQGSVRAVVTDAFLRRLAAHGLRLRQYRVPHNGSVHCTVAPDDDLVVSRLQAPLAGIERVDVVVFGASTVPRERLRDVPFDPAAGELVYTVNATEVRALPASTNRVQLVAVDRPGERVLGEYAFIHTPWPTA